MQVAKKIGPCLVKCANRKPDGYNHEHRRNDLKQPALKAVGGYRARNRHRHKVYQKELHTEADKVAVPLRRIGFRIPQTSEQPEPGKNKTGSENYRKHSDCRDDARAGTHTERESSALHEGPNEQEHQQQKPDTTCQTQRNRHTREIRYLVVRDCPKKGPAYYEWGERCDHRAEKRRARRDTRHKCHNRQGGWDSPKRIEITRA